MKRTIFIILSWLTVLAVNAQSLRQGQMSHFTVKPTERAGVSTKGNRPQASPSSKAKTGSRETSSSKRKGSSLTSKRTSTSQRANLPDTVYSHNKKKPYGWYEPLGILTKEQASHSDVSYSFTHRNAKGHWCKMEVIDGYGRYHTGELSPYILKLNTLDSDTLANREWTEKVDSSCIIELIADPSGEKIVQERAYDEEMDLIYIYSQTPIGKNKDGRQQYVGFFKDKFGLPAEMRKDTTRKFTYGTLVMLTEDKWGNDSIIEYKVSKGREKPNSYGAPMEVFTCDKDGHKLKAFSCDADGKPIIDNWGICGQEITWNKDHTKASLVNMDTDWSPIRVSTSQNEKVIKKLFVYDEFKRLIEIRYVYNDGTPDTDENGVHRIKITYDDKGNITSTRSYDKDGALTPFDGNQISIQIIRYTKDGEYEDIIYLDKNEQPTHSHYHYEYDDLGRLVMEERFSIDQGKEILEYKELYDDKGKTTLKEEYNVEDGQAVLTFRELNNDTIHYELYGDGSFRVDSLDKEGREVYSGRFDKDGNPEEYKISKYFDIDSKSTIIEENFDGNGTPVTDTKGRNKEVTVIDSENCTFSSLGYDLDGDLTDGFIIQYDKYFEQDLAHYDLNAFGVKARCGIAGFRGYKVGIWDAAYEGIAAIYGRDEFDEPDYLETPWDLYYYDRLNEKYDVDNNIITDFDELKDRLPKAMSIEVIDSSAYRLGIRDNDIILLYGDYFNDLGQSSSDKDFRSDWILHSVLDGAKTKRMVVFRIENAQKNQYGLVEINGLTGTPSELGFIAHARYLTKRQQSRIMQSIQDNAVSSHPYISSSDMNKSEWKGNHEIALVYSDMFKASRKKTYAKQIKDPSILLASKNDFLNSSWTMPQGETQSFHSIVRSWYDKTFVLTKDLENLSFLTINGKDEGTHFYFTQVSDEIYDKIMNMFQHEEKQIEEVIATEQLGKKSKSKK